MISSAISAFNSMLAELIPLSLYNDPEDCLIALQDFLLALIYDKKYSSPQEIVYPVERELSPSTPRRKESKKENEDNEKKKKGRHNRTYSKKIENIKSPEPKKYPVDTMEALVGLSIARGSLLSILITIRVLMESYQTNSSNNQQSDLKIIQFIQNLASWKMDFILSPICNRFQSSSLFNIN